MQQRKKIVLYNPKAVFFDMPLALLAVGSALDTSRYEVIIIDGRIESHIDELLALHLPDALCFGISVITGAPLNDALKTSKTVKKHFPGLPVIWGGWHASLFPEQVLADESCVDIVVRGQGEITFTELVANLSNGLDLDSVKGICYRKKDGTVMCNPLRTLSAVEAFNRIDYSFIDVETYFHNKGNRQFDIITSAGCLFRCAFCADPFVYGRKFSALPAKRLADDIEYYYHKYAFTDLNFQDESFFTYSQRVHDLTTELIQRKIKLSWAATMRADQGAKLSDETWRLCKASGLRRLLIGVESGSQEMLDTLNKDIKLEQVYACAEKCRELGIAVIFPFIIGFPGESDESAEATARVMKELKSMSPLFETPAFHFRPYPGSRLIHEAEAGGYRLPATTAAWAEFDFVDSVGPWVSKEKAAYFDALGFYLKLAYGRRRLLLLPFRFIARYRCRYNFFRFPLAMNIFKQLSN
ncbi:MAG: radical SAM protein [Bacteroidota bacterium]